jgi:DNA-binding transcriptional LysR family regulator
VSPPAPELRQLWYFVAVVEEGSMTRAAARLHIAQQSLSEQIHILETQLGAPLLTRTNRGVTPTHVGDVLLEEARAVLAQAARANDAVRRAARGDTGELRLGFLTTVAHDLMPPVIRAFAEPHRDIALHTEDLPIAALVAGVREGRLDAGLSRPPLVDDLTAELVYDEPVAAVLPADHRLTGRAELTLADLAGESWVLTPRSSWPPWHRKYDADFAEAGYRPRVAQRGTTPQALLALVAAGVGVTRLPLSSRNLRMDGVTFVPLTDERAQVVLLTRPDARNPALHTLRQILRDLHPGPHRWSQPDHPDAAPEADRRIGRRRRDADGGA